MNLRGHRGFAAALMLLALVLSAMALLPARAQAANPQITGLVSQCNSPTTFIAGARVTLSDAKGVQPSLTTTTAGDGTFAFTPQASNYTISVTKSGYYSNNTPLPPQVSPFRFDGSATVVVDVCLDAQPTPTTPVVFTVQSSAGSNPVIGGATVSLYDPARLSTPYSALVLTNVTNTTTGKMTANLWSGQFEVRANFSGFALYVNTLTISPPTPVTIQLTPGVSVVGHARNATSNAFVSTGLVGWLYNVASPKSDPAKVIPAYVSGSLFNFSAPNGNYRMIVDADGYEAYDQPITISGSTLSQDVSLQPAPQETFHTIVSFGLGRGQKDWNNLTVIRNYVLNPDSTFKGLGPSDLRDLRQQINYTLGTGTGSGAVSAGDAAAFQQWLLRNGPLYVTTDSFLSVNSKFFTSSMTSYRVSVSNTLLTAGARVWINTSATYQVKSNAWITYGQPQYTLNMNVYPDTNTTVYHNETYYVQLPIAYEMVTFSLLPNAQAITTANYTNVTVDPGLNGQSIHMTIQKSLNGTARAKVTGPSGKFYVVNSTYQNYQAYVAYNTNISFSAAETTNPPSNDSTRDNFTWRFLSNGSQPNPPNNVRWGIQPSFLFPVAGPYRVNLTAIGSGGNVSHRDINILADGITPTADFKTNVTGTGSAIGAVLHFDQGTVIHFDASLSTDQAYTGKAGVILNSGYAWDFDQNGVTDQTGRLVDWTFNKVGTFEVNLTVTDAVGLKSSNATLTITVNDTQAPKPSFNILDPANEYAAANTLTEGHTYAFNASPTTDNHDKNTALNYTWTIPGPVIGSTGGTTTTLYGMNITFGWSQWNLSYAVKLVARDTGFGSNKPNNGTYSQNVSVQIDAAKHPDLFVVVSTVKISTTTPEGGQTVTVTMNVTNKGGRGSAGQVYVSVSEDSTALASTFSMVDKTGATVTNISSGSTVTMTVSFAVTGQGNKTLKILVADRQEPYTWITSENIATESVVVAQPGWVNLAIIGSVVAVFAVVIFAMYYRRKVKAGEWEPRFRRAKGGEGGKEKPRKEKEVKEEKKRL